MSSSETRPISIMLPVALDSVAANTRLSSTARNDDGKTEGPKIV